MADWMDITNGVFEIAGAAFSLLSVRQLRIDKMVRGVHWGPAVFFTVWGVWNLAYYPHLSQWVSTGGSGLLVLVNVWWLLLYRRYSRPRMFSPYYGLRRIIPLGDNIGEYRGDVYSRARDAMDHR